MKTMQALASGALLVALLGCHAAIPNPSATASSPHAAGTMAPPGTPERTPPTCAESPPDYQADVRPLIDRYCSGCHSPGGDAGDEHDFTQLETLRAQRRLVSARLRVRGMPPSTSPQPSESERALLMRWSECG